MRNIILYFTVIAALCSFSIISKAVPPSGANCNLEIQKINDSIFFVENYHQGYQITSQIMMGSPLVSISNDTIYTSGSKYTVAIMIIDSSRCVASQLITKF
jgi:hypothetical protein